MVILMDSYESMKEPYETDLSQLFMRISFREGPSIGVHLIITEASQNNLRLSALFKLLSTSWPCHKMISLKFAGSWSNSHWRLRWKTSRTRPHETWRSRCRPVRLTSRGGQWYPNHQQPPAIKSKASKRWDRLHPSRHSNGARWVDRSSLSMDVRM